MCIRDSDIPGPETDEIGKLAREWNVFIMAQAKACLLYTSRCV